MKHQKTYKRLLLGATCSLASVFLMGAVRISEDKTWVGQETRSVTTSQAQRDNTHGFLLRQWSDSPWITMASTLPNPPTLNVCIVDAAPNGEPANGGWDHKKRTATIIDALKSGFDMWWGFVPTAFFPDGQVRRTSADISFEAVRFELQNSNSHAAEEGQEPSWTIDEVGGCLQDNKHYDLWVLLRHKTRAEGSVVPHNAHITAMLDNLLGQLGRSLGKRVNGMSLGFNENGVMEPLPPLDFRGIVAHEVGHVMGFDDTYSFVTTANGDRTMQTDPQGNIICKMRPDGTRHARSLMCGYGPSEDDRNAAKCAYCNTATAGMRSFDSPCEKQLDRSVCEDLGRIQSPWPWGIH